MVALPTLTVVVPIRNEEENLPQLFERLRATFAQLADIRPKVVYVNDGSTDNSLRIMLEHRAADERFTILDLSRNFGHQPALTAGLAAADGDAVVMMDGDLQDPPELIPQLVASWREGAEVVRAVRTHRSDTGIRRLGYDLFYRIMNWMSDFPIPSHVGVYALLDRRALAELNRLPERNRYLPGLRAWIGFDQRTVLYERAERGAGTPKQTVWHLTRYAFDAFLSFSYKPLRLMIAIGVLVSFCGFALAAVYIVKRLSGAEVAPTGFTTLVTLVLFLGGLQLLAIGLLGEYLGRIYEEVKRRPLYIVKRQYPKSTSAAPDTHGQRD
jgi:polyisoprenyl-phosphate glycosyltransferase